MEDNSKTSEVLSEETPQLSFTQRLTGIFFEPGKTFADINRKPSWLGIFLLMSVFTLALAYVSAARVDPEVAIRKALEASPFQLSEEQKEQAIQQGVARQRNPLYKYGTPLVAPVFVLILYAIIAGLFLLIFVLMGAPLTFKKSYAVTMWGLAPPGIIQQILGIVLLYIKDPNTVDITQGVVMSHLGGLVDSKAQPVLGSLLSSIDLFSFWSIVLLAIGFAAISAKKLTTKKAAVGIVIIWALYVLGKMGFRAFFS